MQQEGRAARTGGKGLGEWGGERGEGTCVLGADWWAGRSEH